jgi:hypothetical protein
VFIYIKAAAGRHSPPTAITNTALRHLIGWRTTTSVGSVVVVLAADELLAVDATADAQWAVNTPHAAAADILPGCGVAAGATRHTDTDHRATNYQSRQHAADGGGGTRPAPHSQQTVCCLLTESAVRCPIYAM